MSKRIFVLFGTRPEAIKLFPVVKELQAHSAAELTVCVTAQHREMLDQVLKLANIVPDIDLDLMEKNQSLDKLSARILLSVGEALDRIRPDRVVVQGDTATAMMGSLAAYYRRIPVSHVEAGLRSGNIYAPWPEEVNRKIVGSIADQHFAPTKLAADVLLSENVPPERVHVTGNTIVDALLATRDMVESDPVYASRWQDLKRRQGNRRLILVTTHRRENFGGGMDRIGGRALNDFAARGRHDRSADAPQSECAGRFAEAFGGASAGETHSPSGICKTLWGCFLLAHIVLTDSGGIQEEAPSLGKPVLVMRDTTERPEGVHAGTARLVGTDRDRIVGETFALLDQPNRYLEMSRAHNPFGDGHASTRIAKVMLDA